MSIQATRKLDFLEIYSLGRSINKRLPQFIWIYMHMWVWIKIHSIGVMLIDRIFHISKWTESPIDSSRDRRTVFSKKWIGSNVLVLKKLFDWFLQYDLYEDRSPTELGSFIRFEFWRSWNSLIRIGEVQDEISFSGTHGRLGIRSLKS